MTEESIFHAALKRSTPADQAQFLDQACVSDAALRRITDRPRRLGRAHRRTRPRRFIRLRAVANIDANIDFHRSRDIGLRSSIPTPTCAKRRRDRTGNAIGATPRLELHRRSRRRLSRIGGRSPQRRFDQNSRRSRQPHRFI